MSQIVDRLVEQRNRAWNNAKEILDRADGAGNIGPQDRAAYDAAIAHLDALDADIRGWVEREQRTALADGLRVDAAARGIDLDARGVASPGGRDREFRYEGENRFGQMVAAEFAAEFRAGELTTALGAGKLTPAQRSGGFLDLLRSKVAFLQSGPQRIFLPAGKHSFDLPKVDTDHAAAWVAENADMSTTGFTGSVVNIPTYKVAGLAYLSQELVGDSDPAVLDEVGRTIVESIARKVEAAVFGNTTTNGPAGFYSATLPSGHTVSAGTNGAVLSNLDTVSDAIAAVENDGGSPAAIFVNGGTWAALRKVKVATGYSQPLIQADVQSPTGKSLFGLPVFVTGALPQTETQGSSSAASSIWVADTSRLYAVFNVQDAALIETDNGLSRWKEHLTGVRGTLRFGLGIPDPKALARVTGVLVA
ncbi:phage major capsid protein [Frankia sp. R43]|uniref:phage major capsid protein n=1 Tax=Frankia sp. R43 TaxID=269536 RepID=UPI0006CA47FA|nr:phage major capsid protein [Frankia sp. R43]